MNNLKNGLYIISTPIGNLDDIGLRAIEVLNNVDFIICENPKHSLKLLNKLGIKKKLISMHDYNEDVVIKKIDKYKKSSVIALISDAGSPLISDPGFKLVKYFIKNGDFVTSVPGPSALIASIQVAGLPLNSFVFFGFVPKSKSQIDNIIKKMLAINLTSVFFVSGNKLKVFLKALLEKSNDQIKEVVVCKELTKINEGIFRDSLSNLIEKINSGEINLKGEFTLIAGKEKQGTKGAIDSVIEAQTSKLLKKFTLTETVEIVHNLTNISKKDIYKMALSINHD